MTLLMGCDFSSSPTPRKPIVLALGSSSNGRVLLSKMERLASLDAFEKWMIEHSDWLVALDFPFGLPRELVQTLGWPTEWHACVWHYSGLSRADVRAAFSGFCNARPVGRKFAHRMTDIPAGASPSMKWVNPPVAYMLHVGVPLLLKVGAHLPGLHVGDHRRVALEGYPGLLAREILGRRSYKSDARSKQTPERLIARKDLIGALESGRSRLGLTLKLTHAQHDLLVADASGDSLDAVLCLMQSAWAQERGGPLYGLPADMDPLEGWIITA